MELPEWIRMGHPLDGDVFEIMTEDATLVATVPFRSVVQLS
ncbi:MULTISPECIES: hypothetical protein [Rhizobium]|nr:hypothetical protein [Rhizobium leguminosarum]